MYSPSQILKMSSTVKRSSSGDVGLKSAACDEKGNVGTSNAKAAASTSNLSGTIYCDLDGTLCDFEGGVAELLKKPYDSLDKKTVWQTLSKTRDFYAKLPWLTEGQKLWKGLEDLSPAILSGVPEGWGTTASRQKRKWVRQELGLSTPILTCLKPDKWKACRKGDILIDDDESHRAKWEERGGIFIHHKGDADSTLASVKELSLPEPSYWWVEVKWEGDWWWCKALARNGRGPTQVEMMEPPHSGYCYTCQPNYLRWPKET